MAYQNNNYQQQGNNYQQQGNNYQQQGNNYQQGNQQINYISVSNVMQWRDGSTTFALTIHGVTIYGMRVVSFTDQRDGQRKRFVAFPKRKGNDGKYYHIAYYKLTDSEEIEILHLVDIAQTR